MNAILAVKERGCGSAGNKRYYYISFSLSQEKGLATQYPRVVFLKMLIRVLQEEKRIFQSGGEHHNRQRRVTGKYCTFLGLLNVAKCGI